MNNGTGTVAGGLPGLPAKTTGAERAEYRRLDGLFDIWLRVGADGRLSGAQGRGAPLDATAIADLVQRGGGAGDDVRVMMDGAAEHREVFAELAGILGRDVHIAPARSQLRYRHGTHREAALVDTVTGRPVDWLVIQPPAMATDLPGWYEAAGGLLRPRTGVVTAPLPGGITLATRADFVARRAAAADLAAGHPELTTIGAAVRGGGFVLGDYGGSYQVVGGRRLAAALSEMPLYGAEVRMWIRWPFDGDEQALLHGNLAAFAENTGAIVWAPERNALTEILESCHDLSAADRAGGPAAWRAYLPPAAGSSRFESDLDGRLSPVGKRIVGSYPGVPLVTVAPERERAMTARYVGLRARHGLFHLDLTVLADGRWAAQHAGGVPHALGPRVLHRMLRAAGWQGEDLVLLAGYPGSAASRLRDYGTQLTSGLRAQVWILPPDADVESLDGAARAVDRDGRPVDWQRLDPGEPQRRWRSENGVLVAIDRSARPSAVAGRAPERPLDPGRPARPSARPGLPPQPPTPATSSPVPSRPAVSRTPAGPDLPVGATPPLVTARRGLRHGIDWLAARPEVNEEPVDLYVVCGCPQAEAVERGVPTPHLFLVGTLRPPAPGTLAAGEHLLRVRVEPGGAVDTSSINVHEPPVVQALLANPEKAYLLPGGLLGRTRLVASYDVAASGHFTARATPPTGPALALRCSGAEHGIEGLPSDVSRWPWEHDATAYALLPGPKVASSNGALVLLRRRPRVRPGHRLLELRVPWRRAVDVRATALQIAGLAPVRSAAAALIEAKVELLLPGGEYERVDVVRVLTAGRLGWRAVGDASARTLAELLADGADRTNRPKRPSLPAASGTQPGSD
ncbi:hypothetical protein C7C45_28260 [Micromonospora arborensis]|uniref:Uncharacterized protein n=1 Tax=Micromonospora arborensis TaxID=2116518 RepID=A0A318NDI6_9ACTN|nr:hypothetical protein [Micromonospora arborensis]PYC65533.1 hypothetical protein C7C45_28260 [Micromonospora arborensis]